MGGNAGLYSRVCVRCRRKDRLCSPRSYFVDRSLRRCTCSCELLSSERCAEAWKVRRGDGRRLESADVPQPRLHSDGFTVVGCSMSFVFREGGLQELGGKALALLRLEQTGLPVPSWFAISPSAFTASLSTVGLTKAQVERATSEHPGRLSSALLLLKPSDEIQREVNDALQALSVEGVRFAVRSSALDEDGSRHSFAGQFDTFLFVDPKEISAKIAAVWRSGFSKRILEYRRQHGLSNMAFAAPPALVQKMSPA